MHRPNQPHLRINLVDLKARLIKRLGLDKSKLYFYYLNKLVSLKIHKVEFNKFCLRIIGRDNVTLHNQLIRSILKNACLAKVPPSGSTQDDGRFDFTSDGYQKNEDGLLSSPCGTRSGISVGSGRAEFSSQKSTIAGNSLVYDNGGLDSHEINKQVQHHQVFSNKTNNEGEVMLCHPAKINEYAECIISVDANELREALIVGEGRGLYAKSSLKAPLGLPFFQSSIGGARQMLHIASGGRCLSSYDSGELLDNETLKERMHQIAAANGIQGMSMDCVNLLNIGLNAFLKRLIRSSIELVGTRCGHDLAGNNIHKHHSHVELINVLPDYHFHMQNGNRPSEDLAEQRCNFPLSLVDFKVAMWLKPQQLGEDWPLLLEKICTRSHRE